MISLHGRPVPGFALGDVVNSVDPYGQLLIDLALLRANAQNASSAADYQAIGQQGADIFGPKIDRVGPSEITQPLTHEAWTLNAQLAATSDAVQAKSLLDLMFTDYQKAITAAAKKRAEKEPSRWRVFLIPLGALVLIGGVWYLAK